MNILFSTERETIWVYWTCFYGAPVNKMVSRIQFIFGYKRFQRFTFIRFRTSFRKKLFGIVS